MRYQVTKYDVGDAFIREYNGEEWLCVLLSRDLADDKERYIWQSSMNPIDGDGLMGGSTTEYFEEDLDTLKPLGRLSVAQKKKLVVKP